MHAATYDSIHAIAPALWDSATRGRPFLSWGWVAHGEAAIGEHAAHYVLIFDDDQPIAGACLYVEHEMVLPYIGIPIVKRALRRLLTRYPPVVCKAPEPINRSGLFFTTPSADARNAALHLILNEAEKIVDRIGGSFVHIDYLHDDDLKLDWRDWQHTTDNFDIGTALDLSSVDSFEHYQRTFLNAKRRKNIRHDQQRAASKGLTVHVADHIPPEIIPTLLDLIHQVNLIYDVDTYPFMDHVLRGLNQYDDAFWIYVTDPQGKIVGTELLLYDPQTRLAIPILFGHDRDTRDVYMIMYYAELRHAIETLGAHRLVGGSGKLDFKFRLGFRHETNKNMVYYPRSQVLRWLGWALNRLPIWQEDEPDD